MKLAQFTTTTAEGQKLGCLLDEKVIDIAELARVVKLAGGEPESWLLDANSTLDLIGRGREGLAAIEGLVQEGQAREGWLQDDVTWRSIQLSIYRSFSGQDSCHRSQLCGPCDRRRRGTAAGASAL